MKTLHKQNTQMTLNVVMQFINGDKVIIRLHIWWSGEGAGKVSFSPEFLAG